MNECKQPVNIYYLYFGCFGLENVSSLNNSESNFPNGKGRGGGGGSL